MNLAEFGSVPGPRHRAHLRHRRRSIHCPVWRPLSSERRRLAGSGWRGFSLWLAGTSPATKPSDGRSQRTSGFVTTPTQPPCMSLSIRQSLLSSPRKAGRRDHAAHDSFSLWSWGTSPRVNPATVRSAQASARGEDCPSASSLSAKPSLGEAVGTLLFIFSYHSRAEPRHLRADLRLFL